MRVVVEIAWPLPVLRLAPIPSRFAQSFSQHASDSIACERGGHLLPRSSLVAVVALVLPPRAVWEGSVQRYGPIQEQLAVWRNRLAFPAEKTWLS